jgi:hypothetical protein
MLVPRVVSPEQRLDQAVVYVLPEDRSLDRRFPERGDRVTLTFKHGGLEPRIAVAKVGTWLEIWNADSVFHQPFSRSLAAPFEGRNVKPRSGTVIQLRATGLIQVYCQLHDGESADLLVLDNTAWTRPDVTGAFMLPPLPRGRYVVHAWHPQLGEQSVPIDVEHPGPMLVELHY